MFQWLLYLVVLIWFFIVAIYLSSMKLYVFKVKGLANDHDCVCNNSYYKVYFILAILCTARLYIIYYIIIRHSRSLVYVKKIIMHKCSHYCTKHYHCERQYILDCRQYRLRRINALKQFSI